MTRHRKSGKRRTRRPRKISRRRTTTTRYRRRVRGGACGGLQGSQFGTINPTAMVAPYFIPFNSNVMPAPVSSTNPPLP